MVKFYRKTPISPEIHQRINQIPDLATRKRVRRHVRRLASTLNRSRGLRLWLRTVFGMTRPLPHLNRPHEETSRESSESESPSS